MDSPVPTSFSPKLNGVMPRFVTNVVNSSEVKLVTTPTQVCEISEPPRETPQALNNSPLVEASSVLTPHNPPPAKLEADTSITISPQTSTSKPESISAMTFEDSQSPRDTSKTSNPTQYEVSSAIEHSKPRVMKGATKTTKSTITLSDLFVKATSSASGFSHTDIQASSPEVGNKILNGMVTPQRPVRKLSPSQLSDSNKVLWSRPILQRMHLHLLVKYRWIIYERCIHLWLFLSHHLGLPSQILHHLQIRKMSTSPPDL